uniref:Uncharacterized protein n=1 Tax=Ditylenchus dipsaci TaxID=166011 RepID=A0A915CN68_9BILA
MVSASSRMATLIVHHIKTLPVNQEIAAGLLENNWSVGFTLGYAAGITDVVDLLIEQYTVEQLDAIGVRDFRNLPQDVKDKVYDKLDQN